MRQGYAYIQATSSILVFCKHIATQIKCVKYFLPLLLLLLLLALLLWLLLPLLIHQCDNMSSVTTEFSSQMKRKTWERARDAFIFNTKLPFNWKLHSICKRFNAILHTIKRTPKCSSSIPAYKICCTFSFACCCSWDIAIKVKMSLATAMVLPKYALCNGPLNYCVSNSTWNQMKMFGFRHMP